MPQLHSLVIALGGLGAFLLGMNVAKEGLTALAGDALRRALARFTRSPSSGALTGALVTALVQSSSATTVAAVGFVGSGLLSFPQALGIVFGANAGTTLTGWIVVLLGFKLEIAPLASLLLFVGALLRLFGRGRVGAWGFALAGFGLLFLGLDLLREGMGGLVGVLGPQVGAVPGWLGRTRLVAVGLALTLVTQSSSAGVALALSALEAGALSWQQAAALVIGMDVGTTFAALLASLGGSVAARRTGLAHVVYNVLTGLATFAMLPVWAWTLGPAALDLVEREPGLSLVLFHSGFNVLGVLVALPLTRRFARLMERLVPERRSPLVRGLDPALLSDPPVALRAARAALERIAGAAWIELAALQRRGARAPEATLAFTPIVEALEAAREHLGHLRTSPQRPADHEAHEALMHALDHLERLCARAGRGRPPGLRADAALGAVRARFEQVLDALAQAPDEAAIAAAEALAHALQTEEVAVRLSILHQAAEGALTPDEALELLDERRNLRRMAEHCWRVAYHLHAPLRPGASATTDEVAPGAGSSKRGSRGEVAADP